MFTSEGLPGKEQVYYQYSRVGGLKPMGLLYIKASEIQVLFPFFFLSETFFSDQTKA